jgi:hypothetical protein
MFGGEEVARRVSTMIPWCLHGVTLLPPPELHRYLYSFITTSTTSSLPPQIHHYLHRFITISTDSSLSPQLHRYLWQLPPSPDVRIKNEHGHRTNPARCGSKSCKVRKRQPSTASRPRRYLKTLPLPPDLAAASRPCCCHLQILPLPPPHLPASDR